MSEVGLLAAGALALCLVAPAHAAPDAIRGEQLYARCQACHALATDRVGPHHCGLFGRLAGSVPGFVYSPALKNSKIVWNDKTLDRFLAGPLKMVPGSTMTYDGVPDAKERADLIAYLKRVNDTPECANKDRTNR
jgi:cytochrome c